MRRSRYVSGFSKCLYITAIAVWHLSATNRQPSVQPEATRAGAAGPHGQRSLGRAKGVRAISADAKESYVEIL